ncbi:STP1 protein [Plasmodium malariae]|uniref:STP1 protein n=1 Tax=Plasmodium malariae TaxID=5858 RepID=A0A1D3JHC2_PLAMA|nr:STP1 protein [Plasmodium malariae]SBT85564.1 STP1 protein [Plasmodium malariae]
MSAPKYVNQDTWEEGLKKWLQPYYNVLTKYGGCPMILEQTDKELLQLAYDADDFCEKNKNYMEELQVFKIGNKILYKCNGDLECTKQCTEYKTWFEERKTHFKNNKSFIEKNYKCIKKKKVFPTRSCNVLNPLLFNKIPQCLELHQANHVISALEIKKQSTPEEQFQMTDNELSSTQDKNTDEAQHPLKPQIPIEKSSVPEDQTDQAEVIQAEDPEYKEPSHSKSSDKSEVSNILIQEQFTQQSRESQMSEERHSNQTLPATAQRTNSVSSSIVFPTILNIVEYSHKNYISPILISILVITVFTLFLKYALVGGIKKKKKKKRTQVKLLKILLPSFTDKKSKFITNDHTEHSVYDNEQIIKKLKIHEHSMKKNENPLKQKKDRFKTIIEVHMEVLGESKNEEWEYKKQEFLHICLELFAKAEYSTYPNLTNEELIMENTKSINDIEKQKILCNKWVREHRNISEKLKKTDWFNNLKNEWKNEKDTIKNSVELKMNFSNENQKFSFLEKEKDLWKKWISKKHMIIEQYLQQKWFDEFTQEFLNMSDEYVNEESKNNISLLNSQELRSKEFHEELYSYIKKKLIAKLCILVFMMVLEECKKEDFIENEGLHLDSYINDWTTEVNLGRKSDVTKEIIKFNGNVLENTENTKIPAYTGKEVLSQEIEKWVRVEDTPENSIYNENIVE